MSHYSQETSLDSLGYLVHSSGYGQQYSLIEKYFSIPSPTRVNNFLRNNRDLIPIILMAHSVIRELFKQERLVLSTMSDPEQEVDDHINLYILTELNAKFALEKLEKVEEDPRLDDLNREYGRIVIHIELS